MNDASAALTYRPTRTIALVGLMGVGKTSVGRRLATALGLPFRDADREIELAAGCSVSDIFAERGEAEFRAGERRVIARLLDEPTHVLATGGGALVQPDTRALIKARALSVWLKADIEVLARRVARKTTRPLLIGRDPLELLTAHARDRYPFYREAHLTVESGDGSHGATVDAVLAALKSYEKAAAPMRRVVRVGLDERAYEVVIGPGLIADAGRELDAAYPRRRTVIVTDTNVAGLHADSLIGSLRAGGVDALLIVLPPGEETKSFDGLADLSDRLLALELDRGDVITALGGGVIGDLTGFAAAIYKRGIDFVQIPTTLLAQVDSSVGGKTAIDTPRGKNLVGAFHQPRRVLADLDVLKTLPARELRCGYAEIIKYGLLGDFAFFERLEREGAAVLALEPEALARAVHRSVEMKADIVAEDETEQGRRALLNLGHTFGHALEAETGFGGALLHGEAVGVGMALAFRFSAALGLCSGQDAARAAAGIAAAGLPTKLSDVHAEPFAADRLIHHMAQDKKAEGGRLTFVLARAIGDAFVAKGVEPDKLTRFLIAEGAV